MENNGAPSYGPGHGAPQYAPYRPPAVQHPQQLQHQQNQHPAPSGVQPSQYPRQNQYQPHPPLHADRLASLVAGMGVDNMIAASPRQQRKPVPGPGGPLEASPSIHTPQSQNQPALHPPTGHLFPPTPPYPSDASVTDTAHPLPPQQNAPHSGSSPEFSTPPALDEWPVTQTQFAPGMYATLSGPPPTHLESANPLFFTELQGSDPPKHSNQSTTPGIQHNDALPAQNPAPAAPDSEGLIVVDKPGPPDHEGLIPLYTAGSQQTHTPQSIPSIIQHPGPLPAAYGGPNTHQTRSTYPISNTTDIQPPYPYPSSSPANQHPAGDFHPPATSTPSPVAFTSPSTYTGHSSSPITQPHSPSPTHQATRMPGPPNPSTPPQTQPSSLPPPVPQGTVTGIYSPAAFPAKPPMFSSQTTPPGPTHAGTFPTPQPSAIPSTPSITPSSSFPHSQHNLLVPPRPRTSKPGKHTGASGSFSDFTSSVFSKDTVKWSKKTASRLGGAIKSAASQAHVAATNAQVAAQAASLQRQKSAAHAKAHSAVSNNTSGHGPATSVPQPVPGGQPQVWAVPAAPGVAAPSGPVRGGPYANPSVVPPNGSSPVGGASVQPAPQGQVPPAWQPGAPSPGVPNISPGGSALASNTAQAMGGTAQVLQPRVSVPSPEYFQGLGGQPTHHNAQGQHLRTVVPVSGQPTPPPQSHQQLPTNVAMPPHAAQSVPAQAQQHWGAVQAQTWSAQTPGVPISGPEHTAHFQHAAVPPSQFPGPSNQQAHIWAPAMTGPVSYPDPNAAPISGQQPASWQQPHPQWSVTTQPQQGFAPYPYQWNRQQQFAPPISSAVQHQHQQPQPQPQPQQFWAPTSYPLTSTPSHLLTGSGQTPPPAVNYQVSPYNVGPAYLQYPWQGQQQYPPGYVGQPQMPSNWQGGTTQPASHVGASQHQPGSLHSGGQVMEQGTGAVGVCSTSVAVPLEGGFATATAAGSKSERGGSGTGCDGSGGATGVSGTVEDGSAGSDSSGGNSAAGQKDGGKEEIICQTEDKESQGASAKSADKNPTVPEAGNQSVVGGTTAEPADARSQNNAATAP
ncbi:hypothetical protein BT67DRAFT_444998 [Trichocladium antarcticum]|uniref:Uncharacterized protein n=1 Tax=Trichocladium antarcticum TaxID=1450529 RepID=A0AAN6UEK3_9PEZI|nr:hypothetical protein BT67DRAFT_444998 [Trichocladium antarcticum]